MVPYWPTATPDSQIRTPVTRTVAARKTCEAAGGSEEERSQTTSPVKAMPTAVPVSATSSPPLGCGRSNDIATRPAPAIISIAVARASERPGGRIASFWIRGTFKSRYESANRAIPLAWKLKLLERLP
jgi:hypothetical protein